MVEKLETVAWEMVIPHQKKKLAKIVRSTEDAEKYPKKTVKEKSELIRRKDVLDLIEKEIEKTHNEDLMLLDKKGDLDRDKYRNKIVRISARRKLLKALKEKIEGEKEK